MNWIDVAWIMMASASLTLGLIYLVVWFRQRTHYAYLTFFMLAASVAVFGAFELHAVRAQTAAQYAIAVRWAQVPLCGVVLSILGFVRLYFKAGRPWLAYSSAGLRVLALVLSFVVGPSVQFQQITELAHVTLWGGAVVSTPIGIVSPWIVVPQLSNVLLAAFVADASITLWRRGGVVERLRAARVGGALVLCIIVAAVLGALVVAGILRTPTMLTPCFLVVVLAVGYELGSDLIHAAQLSRELRESERRMELAAQAAELAFWSWDMTRDEVVVNAKGRAMLEFAGSQQIGLDDLLSRVAPDDRDSVRGALQRVRQIGGGYEWDFRLALPTGAQRWIATRGQVETDRAGRPILLHGVALDITAQVGMERQVARQRSELAHLSRVATLGELSGSLAHEINQPLMGILSNAQAALRFMAADNVNLGEVREILMDIVEDDKRAGEVIQRLRALLKKGEVQHGSLDINDVVGDILRLTRNDLINRDVAATSELAPNLPLVRGDRIQLQQVLLNLVVNACDAMDDNQESRRLRIRSYVADDAGVEIAVSDCGRGIPAPDLESVFEPFVTTKEHGMGLGLAICRTIVTAHGGRLWAESTVGEGATFRFTLPLSRPAQ